MIVQLALNSADSDDRELIEHIFLRLHQKSIQINVADVKIPVADVKNEPVEKPIEKPVEKPVEKPESDTTPKEFVELPVKNGSKLFEVVKEPLKETTIDRVGKAFYQHHQDPVVIRGQFGITQTTFNTYLSLYRRCHPEIIERLRKRSKSEKVKAHKTKKALKSESKIENESEAESDSKSVSSKTENESEAESDSKSVSSKTEKSGTKILDTDFWLEKYKQQTGMSG